MMRTDRTISNLVLTLIIVLSVVTVIPVTQGAEATEVTLTADQKEITSGETVTYEIVVESADGGVGTVNAEVSLNDTAVATITDASLNGFSSQFSTVTIADDGSSVSFEGAAGNTTANTGSVAVATITVTGEGAGTAALDLTVNELSDENGATYTVGSVNDATVTVNKQQVSIGFLDTNHTIVNGEKQNVRLIVENVTDGIGSFGATISVDVGSVVTVADAKVPENELTNATITANGTTVQIAASALTLDRNESITVTTLTLRARSVGKTGLSIRGVTIGDINGSEYDISDVTNMTINVRERPDPLNEEYAGSPSNTDSDKAFEDVNGDSESSLTDVTALWRNRETIPKGQYDDLFDFNDSGDFTLSDITYFYQEISSA